MVCSTGATRELCGSTHTGRSACNARAAAPLEMRFFWGAPQAYRAQESCYPPRGSAWDTTAFTNSWLSVPQGCKAVQKSAFPAWRTKKPLLLRKQHLVQEQVLADVNETSVTSWMFSMRHFPSQGKVRHSLCSTPAVPQLFPQFSSAQDKLLSPNTS